jgi:SAM-dependent methyltransferase
VTRSRWERRVRHVGRVALTPRLWGEQLRYWRYRSTGPQFPKSPWSVRLHPSAPAVCNICGWAGSSFEGVRHSNEQRCLSCGSIGRDRFLFWCMQQRVERPSGLLRVLETSPRMGEDYRLAMARWFDYKASDFDERAHRASIRIDLQDIALPDASLDLILTPHVLEHVPGTDRALAELHRVIAPGGRMLIQVPVLQGVTAPPIEPEFHDDDTPVFWRFGPDLVERLRAHGFETRLLCSRQWFDEVTVGHSDRVRHFPEFDVDSMLAGSTVDDLAPILDTPMAERLGLWEPCQFLVFEGVRG